MPSPKSSILFLPHLPLALAVLGSLVACAPAPPAGEGPPDEAGAAATGTEGAGDAAAPAGTQRALFPAYPEALLQAAVEACDDPSQTVVRPSRNEVRCETLPAPEAAAALILGYDGTVEDLPRFVIGFRAEPQDGGAFLVTAENYIRVPRRDAPTRQIRLRDPVIGAGLRELLVVAGGTPL